MTGQEDDVGFLATESGVKQFQPSVRGFLCPSVPSLLPGTPPCAIFHDAQSRRYHRRRPPRGGLVGKQVGAAWGHGRSEDRLQVLDAGHLHRQRRLCGVQPSSSTPCHFDRRPAISGQQTKQPSALRRKPALHLVARSRRAHCQAKQSRELSSGSPRPGVILAPELVRELPTQKSALFLTDRLFRF